MGPIDRAILLHTYPLASEYGWVPKEKGRAQENPFKEQISREDRFDKLRATDVPKENNILLRSWRSVPPVLELVGGGDLRCN